MVPLLLLAVLAAPAAAADTCRQSGAAEVRNCPNQEAQVLPGRQGWIACGGRCLVTEDANGVSIMDAEKQQSSRFEGARFLPGAGNTHSLAALALLSGDRQLLLIDADGFAPMATLPLVGLVDGDPATLPRFIDEAHLSSDGRRFFIPSPDTSGFTAYTVDGGRLTPIEPRHPVLLTSPSGRYGLTVDPDGNGTFTVRDYVLDFSFATPARFEIDLPFFDADEAHFLRRHRIKAGQLVDVFRLSDGVYIGSVLWPETAGLDVRVEVRKRGIRLVELFPEAR